MVVKRHGQKPTPKVIVEPPERLLPTEYTVTVAETNEYTFHIEASTSSEMRQIMKERLREMSYDEVIITEPQIVDVEISRVTPLLKLDVKSVT